MGPASWDAMRWLAAARRRRARAAPPAVHVLGARGASQALAGRGLHGQFWPGPRAGQQRRRSQGSLDQRRPRRRAGAWSRPCCAPPGTSACARPSCRATCTWRPGAWSIAGRGAGRQLGADPAADLDRGGASLAGVRHGAAVLPRAQQRGRFRADAGRQPERRDDAVPGLEPLRDGGRNWLALELDEGAGKLWASWRCETGILHQPSAGDRSGQGPGWGNAEGRWHRATSAAGCQGGEKSPPSRSSPSGMSPAVAAAIIAAKAAGGRGG